MAASDGVYALYVDPVSVVYLMCIPMRSGWSSELAYAIRACLQTNKYTGSHALVFV